MTALVRIASIIICVTLIAGCGDDDNPVEGDSLELADLVGSWIATSDVHTNSANAAQSFDLVANGGEVRTTILSPGTAVRTWVEIGTFSDEWDSALSLSGNTLTSNPVEDGRPTRTYTVTLVGDVLTLTDENSTFDFTLTGAAGVPTREVIVFVPNT